MENKTYHVPSFNMARLRDRIAKLNKRALKIGVEPVGLTVLNTYEKKGRVEKHNITYYEISVSGVAPKYQGWTFGGTIEHTEAGNILRAVPGSEIPEEYRGSAKECGHCQKQRNRKDTYIVIHESGQVKQLGKSCLKDYTGHVSPEWLAQMAELIDDIEELEGGEYSEESEHSGGARRSSMVPTDLFMEKVCQAIAIQGGYITSKQAMNSKLMSTANLAFMQFYPTKDNKEHIFEVTEESKAKAKEIMQAISNREVNNNFEHNVKVALSSKELERKQAGIAASAVLIFERDLVKKLEFKKRDISVHLGASGEKMEKDVTIHKKFVLDTMYGTMRVIIMLDDAGNTLVWKTSTDSGLETGDKATVKFTVKKHSEYKGIKQTEVVRLKVLEKKLAA